MSSDESQLTEEQKGENTKEKRIADLVPGYDPYIADVPIESLGEPFPREPCPYSCLEITDIKKQLHDQLLARHFDPPVRLDHFCLVVKERWERSDELDIPETQSKCCILV